MDWIEQLEQQLATQDITQLSIDGQIWTIDCSGPSCTLTNSFGRSETFDSIDHLITSLESRLENPTIAVL